MCVPVRFKWSRKNSTSRVRGSTAASRNSPFTRMRTRVLSAADIFVSCLHAFAARSPRRDAYRSPHQCRNQPAFVFGGATHVALWFGGVLSRFGSALNGFGVELVATKLGFGLCCAKNSQADAAQSDASVLATIFAVERELNGSADRSVYGSASLE